MTSEYGLLVRFRLHDHAVAAFDALVAVTVEQIRAHEPDTLVYVSHDVQDHPNERVFYELYRDRDAFVSHEEQPHVQRFLREREQYVEAFAVDVLHPLQGTADAGAGATYRAGPSALGLGE